MSQSLSLRGITTAYYKKDYCLLSEAIQTSLDDTHEWNTDY